MLILVIEDFSAGLKLESQQRREITVHKLTTVHLGQAYTITLLLHWTIQIGGWMLQLDALEVQVLMVKIQKTISYSVELIVIIELWKEQILVRITVIVLMISMIHLVDVHVHLQQRVVDF